MDYQQALNYILSLTDYEKMPGVQYTSTTYDLKRVEDLLAVLGSPHLRVRTAHVAGTKGKGSTTAMIAAALTRSGCRTGMYTSPHFHTMRERVQIDGVMISEDDFARIASQIHPAAAAINAASIPCALTTFEVLTALAFVYFAEQKVDYQVLEVGLGGRLDATNVVRPDVCVITSISMDHTEVLGKTIDAIAVEKAGIVKPGSTVVCARQDGRAHHVIAEICRERKARLIQIGQQVTYSLGDPDSSGQRFAVSGLLGHYCLDIPLLGEHQAENATCAVAALEVLAEQDSRITADSIVHGLGSVRWAGRLQVLRRDPWVVCDGAHNADSVVKLRLALRRHFSFDKAVLVVATSMDKDIPGIVGELAQFSDEVIVTRTYHPRAAQPDTLADEFTKWGISAAIAPSVSQAIEMALTRAKPDDLVCVTGSLFLVGETLELAQ